MMEHQGPMDSLSSAIKVDGQVDLLISLLAKLSSLERPAPELRESMRTIMVTGLELVRNETMAAFRRTNMEEFAHILSKLERAIMLAQDDKFYAAGDLLTSCATDPKLIMQRAMDSITGPKTDRIF
ncbi:MAG: hypothetical protein RQ758_06210 [Methanomicrobiaceae archaeon]|nr:hypothetical protein [Methanomicrobiaceae archaeon]